MTNFTPPVWASHSSPCSQNVTPWSMDDWPRVNHSFYMGVIKPGQDTQRAHRNRYVCRCRRLSWANKLIWRRCVNITHKCFWLLWLPPPHLHHWAPFVLSVTDWMYVFVSSRCKVDEVDFLKRLCQCAITGFCHCEPWEGEEGGGGVVTGWGVRVHQAERGQKWNSFMSDLVLFWQPNE